MVNQRRFILIGGIVGLSLTAVLTSFMYVGQQSAKLPFVPFDLFDSIARIPQLGGIITKFIEATVAIFSGPGVRTDAAAKTFELSLAILQFLVIGGIAGAIYAPLHSRLRARLHELSGLPFGVVAWLIALVVELRTADQSSSLMTNLTWLAVLYGFWSYALSWALESFSRYEHAATPTQINGRRQFFLQFGASVIALTLGGWVLGNLSGKNSSSALAGQEIPTPTGGPELSATANPAAASNSASFVPAPGTRPEVTANEDFYRVDVNAIPPDIDDKTWALSVGGQVKTPLNLTYADLMKMSAVQQDATLECISNEVGGSLISNTRWTGVRLKDVLNQAGLNTGVVAVKFTCADGYTESLPLESALDDRTLLAYAMNGRALERQHGFPLRIYTPNRYGMKNPKWLIGIEALNSEYSDGYWEVRGWDKDAIVKTTSVIDTIANDQRENDLVPIGGIAFSGARQISKVEVSIDGGEWQTAKLKDPISPLTWRFWRYNWKPTSGGHEVRVRATDGDGKLQTDVVAPLHPDGASGYDSRSINV